MSKTSVLVSSLILSLSSVANAELRWLEGSPTILKVDGCDRLSCIGDYQDLSVSSTSIGSKISFMACYAQDSGRACPSANDCKKIAYEMTPVQIANVSNRGMTEELKDQTGGNAGWVRKFRWSKDPVVFSVPGNQCSDRKFCGGADAVENSSGGTSSVAYYSVLCGVGDGTCFFKQCRQERTPGVRVLTPERVLNDGETDLAHPRGKNLVDPVVSQPPEVNPGK